MVVAETVVEEAGVQAAVLPPTSPKQHLHKYADYLHFTMQLNKAVWVQINAMVKLTFQQTPALPGCLDLDTVALGQ